ncbi:hypothetical protein FRC11_002918, partial [Ceratobasidium sp. 423]
IREKEQRRRGREIDVEWEEQPAELKDSNVINVPSETITWMPLSGDEEPPRGNPPHLRGAIEKKAKNVKKAKEGEQAVSLGETVSEGMN